MPFEVPGEEREPGGGPLAAQAAPPGRAAGAQRSPRAGPKEDRLSELGTYALRLSLVIAVLGLAAALVAGLRGLRAGDAASPVWAKP